MAEGGRGRARPKKGDATLQNSICFSAWLVSPILGFPAARLHTSSWRPLYSIQTRFAAGIVFICGAAECADRRISSAKNPTTRGRGGGRGRVRPKKGDATLQNTSRRIKVWSLGLKRNGIWRMSFLGSF